MAYERKDGFYRRAKAAGYRSRAAYKLLDLSRRYRLIAPGDRVVDLGAWPGGWLQVAAELTGARGVVVGVDVVPIDPLPGHPHVSVLVGDASDPEVQRELKRRVGGTADVVLSDMAPKLTGVRARDAARADELVRLGLAVAAELLGPGGRLLLKLFMNEDSEAVVADARRRFASVKLSRPEASRKGSAEMYLIALGFRGRAEPKRG